MKTFAYGRGQQTLCTVCGHRVQSNGDRFVHLVVYGHDIHDARPDWNLLGDGDDPWFAERLRLMESPQ